MAKYKSPEPPPIIPKEFTADEIEKGIAKINRRIKDVKALKESKTQWEDEIVNTTEFNIIETIREVFGPNSPEFSRYKHHDIWDGPHMIGGDGDEQRYFEQGIIKSVTMLEGLIKRLEEKRSELDIIKDDSKIQTNINSKDIFIVHGHDGELKNSVVRFISKIDLNPIILHEQPNAGRTVIEKLEHYSNVGYAIVLLTPDDVGASKTEQGNLKERSRQNVLIELGYFFGKLGRNRVCALYKEGVEIPSDIYGIIYVPVDPYNAWMLKVAQEIKQAGVEVDLNKTI